jgi:hypothetical protein
MDDLDFYRKWGEKAGIEAPKVVVKTQPYHEGNVDGDETDNTGSSKSQRGLFATETIHPGERILFIPAQALIHRNFLQRTGEKELQKQGYDLVAEVADEMLDQPQSLEDWERLAVGRIEEVRQMIEGELREVAANVGYSWREDDAVALYLASCRYILKHKEKIGPPKIILPDTTVENQTEDEEEREEPDSYLVFDPPITQAVPLGENGRETSLENDLEPCVVVEDHFSSPATETTTINSPSFLHHVALLPEQFTTSPLYYTAKELERIDGTNCHEFATRMRQQIESDWSQLHHVLSAYHQSSQAKLGRCYACSQRQRDCTNIDEDSCWCQRYLQFDQLFTLDEYKWALANIYSRSTDFKLDDGKPFRVIAPFFDMINHDFTSTVNHAMDLQGNLSVFNGTEMTIEAGEEVLLSYGYFSNEKLLLIYGFTVPDNPYDAVSIYAPIRPDDPLYQVKVRILQTKCGVENANEPHVLYAHRRWQNQNILPASLLSVLRVIGITSSEEVLAVASRENVSHGEGESLGVISVENEKAALSALNDALWTMSRRIALSLISDEGLKGASGAPRIPSDDRQPGILVGGDPSASSPGSQVREGDEQLSTRSPNIVNAKNLCQSEYLILQHSLAEVSERLEELEGSSTGSTNKYYGTATKN